MRVSEVGCQGVAGCGVWMGPRWGRVWWQLVLLLTSSTLTGCIPSDAQLSLNRSQKSGFLGKAFKYFKLLAII